MHRSVCEVGLDNMTSSNMTQILDRLTRIFLATLEFASYVNGGEAALAEHPAEVIVTLRATTNWLHEFH